MRWVHGARWTPASGSQLAYSTPQASSLSAAPTAAFFRRPVPFAPQEAEGRSGSHAVGEVRGRGKETPGSRRQELDEAEFLGAIHDLIGAVSKTTLSYSRSLADPTGRASPGPAQRSRQRSP